MPLLPLSASTFVRNLMAYGASEVAAKASRLVVAIAVAHTMNVGQIGLAAGAMAAADILKALTENGIGQRIIAARASELAPITATAHRLFWGWCTGLTAVQLGVAAVLYANGGGAALALLIALLAAEYLFMPAGLVQAALAMREGKLRQTAAISAGQIVAANILSAGLAVAWPSALALILPRLLTAPLWLVAMRRLRPWMPDLSHGYAPVRPFLSFGGPVLGVEVVKALRLQADKLVVGLLLGADVLGLYFIAFNAGLSLATSFSTAFSVVLFPYLCAAEDRVTALRQSLLLGMGLITPLVVTQAVLAPYYLPVLFGPRWDGISDVVTILCLAAIPITLWSAAAGWLRATGRPGVELLATVVGTVALTLNAAVLAPFGLTAIATGYLVVATVTMGGAALAVLFNTVLPNPEMA